MRSFFRSDALVVLVGLLLTNPVLAAAPAATNDRPNFVVIMVDDMGFSDPGCYGGEINTPNIDRLASDGLRFTQFYNCSRCCQTRASLLTGAYPERVGMRDFGRSMDTDVPTLAENLRRGGYATSMSGKWHLTELPAKPTGAQRILWMNHELQLKRPFGNKATYPTRRGFENFYGIIWGVVDHFDPFSLTDGETPVADVPDDYYATDAITSHAAQYIEDAVDTDKPFFLYVAYTAPHWPIQAPAADISKYHGKYSDGWQSLRQQRFARQQELGLFDTSVPLGELSGRSPEWDNMSPEDREFEAAKMEVHAAMVDRVDQGIGKLIAELKRSGVYENTCILFLSDNGASPEIPGGPGYDRYSGTRDGRTAWRDAKLRRPENRAKLGTEESYTGIGHTWASAVNTPLRYWKMESYDGGCRTPMIVHWPQGIANRRGEFVADVGHVIDIAPTLYELSGVQPVAETLCDGTSLAPVLAGEPTLEPRHLFFQHGNGAGVRYGKWKASKRSGENWELFDLSQDPGETTNLASSHPEQLDELLSAWNTWQADLAGTTLDTAATSAAAKAAKQ
ncbi:arylsulfatase [Aeoliella sp. ICT_H6.2]|uniref:Arylsulfatase n=1 Tax=Aeoliella straminimaris TaxID=2954799 RepID=A0A9X2FEB8_9BACT|nr:arylsulfatase [Aeoliella straminimaris]MCO6047124.1 arylsulfatase [Aeoliella straminimaris]